MVGVEGIGRALEGIGMASARAASRISKSTWRRADLIVDDDSDDEMA